MKKIGITQRLVDNTAYVERRDALDVRWAELLTQNGYLPILLPTYADANLYFSEMKLDGVIISGGNDLFAISGQELDQKRDQFEKNVYSIAKQRKLPIWGICRGLQLICDKYGLSLDKVSGHVGDHEIEITSESKFLKVETPKLKVNSFHNYSPKVVPKDFQVIAKSIDGYVEAMEHKELPIFCQMWHPERVSPFAKMDLATLKNLFG